MKSRFFLIVFLSISQISCNSNLTQKKSAYDKEIQIPDRLKGKDLEGNEILLGEININQLKEFTKDLIRRQMAQFGQMSPEDKELEDIAARILSNQEEVKRISEQLMSKKLLDFYKENANLKEKEDGKN